jgi:hypothetical protein
MPWMKFEPGRIMPRLNAATVLAATTNKRTPHIIDRFHHAIPPSTSRIPVTSTMDVGTNRALIPPSTTAAVQWALVLIEY